MTPDTSHGINEAWIGLIAWVVSIFVATSVLVAMNMYLDMYASVTGPKFGFAAVRFVWTWFFLLINTPIPVFLLVLLMRVLHLPRGFFDIVFGVLVAVFCQLLASNWQMESLSHGNLQPVILAGAVGGLTYWLMVDLFSRRNILENPDEWPGRHIS